MSEGQAEVVEIRTAALLITSTPANQLVLETDRGIAIRRYVVFAICFGFIAMAFMFALMISEDEGETIALSIFLVCSIAAVTNFCYRAIYIAARGKVFEFDNNSGCLTLNGRIVAMLKEIGEVTIECSGGYPSTYDVYAGKVRITRILTDFKEAEMVAETVARYLSVAVRTQFCYGSYEQLKG